MTRESLELKLPDIRAAIVKPDSALRRFLPKKTVLKEELKNFYTLGETLVAEFPLLPLERVLTTSAFMTHTEQAREDYRALSVKDQDVLNKYQQDKAQNLIKQNQNIAQTANDLERILGIPAWQTTRWVQAIEESAQQLAQAFAQVATPLPTFEQVGAFLEPIITMRPSDLTESQIRASDALATLILLKTRPQ